MTIFRIFIDGRVLWRKGTERMDTYLDMLQDSLKKKLEILNRIMDHQKKEADMLREESMDMEAFDKSINEKVELAESIDSLDDGFEQSTTGFGRR